jgi:3-hydroxyisobutyrate dehydrogenase-like beta-hydroxyacid dehydrogenase
MSVIGFIGLGIMGRGMLNNLVTKLDPATSFVIWNRTTDICTTFATKHNQRQIAVASSASEVINKSDITISMLSTEEASAAVVSAKENIFVL